jgi:hypothetical protein
MKRSVVMPGHRYFSRVLLLGALLVAAASCKKNPIDAALDEALDFSGFFEAENGMVIELDVPGGRAEIRKFGSSPFGSMLKLNDPFILGMYQVGDKYRGHVRGNNGFFDWSDITLVDGKLNISSTMPGHQTWRPSSAPSTPGTPSTPATGTSTTLLSQGGLAGNLRSQRTYKVTVPTGVKSLVAELTEEPGGGQLADMFLRRGQAPTASHDPYVWTADCAGVQPNRETERCVVTNPVAGDYYVMVYGYHEYWGAKLTISIVR